MSPQQQQDFDPGLTQKFNGTLRRSIEKDGSFNVHRTGVKFRNINLYLELIEMSWPRFIALVVATYAIVNCAFAGVYMLLGIENLKGAVVKPPLEAFESAFFFSAHTLTTVGYGNVFPNSTWTNLAAVMEAMSGLMGFAIATGLLYGRFSRPSARIVFSDSMIVAPYQGITSLQFRVANQRTNVLMDLEAKVLLMTVESADGSGLKRSFKDLRLERQNVYFFPLTWTVVHPIDSSSPLFGKSPEDLARLQAEILIMIKGFDDTFSQTVNARYSYQHHEIVWGAKFVQAFYVDERGDMVLELDRINDLAKVELSATLLRPSAPPSP